MSFHMRTASITALVVVLSGLGPPAHGASNAIDVTPENVEQLPVALHVEATAGLQETVTFTVTVQQDSQLVSTRHEGRLEVLFEPPTPFDGTASLQRPALWCSIREEVDKNQLVYRFGVSQEMLPKATFQFRSYDPTMPSMDLYRLFLGTFFNNE